MKKFLTEKLLYIVATVADHNRNCFSWHLALSMSDDPDRYKYRRWLEKELKNKKSRKQLQDALSALKRRKFLQEKVFGSTRGYILTSKGRLRVLKMDLEKTKKKKLKNGHYIMVFFDIPEKLRKVRNTFRFYLRELGFEQLQKSVWLSNFDVLEALNELIKDCKLEEHAKVLMVKEIDFTTKK